MQGTEPWCRRFGDNRLARDAEAGQSVRLVSPNHLLCLGETKEVDDRAATCDIEERYRPTVNRCHRNAIIPVKGYRRMDEALHVHAEANKLMGDADNWVRQQRLWKQTDA